MRRVGILVGASLLAACAQQTAGGAQALRNQQDSVSYIIGYQMGGSLKQQGVEVEATLFNAGFRDGSSGSKPRMTEEEMMRCITAYQGQLMTKQRGQDSIAAAENKKAGDAFLAANKSKPGVVTMPNGLQYKVVKAGTGPRPTATSSVTVKYKGTLLDGTEFDSSGSETVTFQLNRVIPGWTQGLQQMNAGSVYQFYIPGELAYGEAGSPPRIGPNATLIFDVELVSFK